ncbi:hypothetical protein QQF64_018895 [Cirrhinus molitorella]|uniref:Uncharacterized protein n=1 Tax=Cirrhinus molitorella TaxID=172907 RepID=A0ABR3LHC3_9TELE
MAERSEETGSEMGFEEEGGRDRNGWNTMLTRKRKKKDKGASNIDETDSDQSMTITSKQQEEYKVIMKLSQEGSSFGEWNPVHLTKSINKLLGEIKNAKVFRSGALLIFCRNKMQQEKAIELNRIDGKRVKCVLSENKMLIRGVITGIPVNVVEEQIRDNVTGAKVLEVKRLRTTRNGEKCDSLSVMIKFDETRLPNKVYIGYMSYEVRPYIPTVEGSIAQPTADVMLASGLWRFSE